MKYFALLSWSPEVPTKVINVLVEAEVDGTSEFVSYNWSWKRWMHNPGGGRYIFLPEYREYCRPISREQAEELLAADPSLTTALPLPSEETIDDLSRRKDA